MINKKIILGMKILFAFQVFLWTLILCLKLTSAQLTFGEEALYTSSNVGADWAVEDLGEFRQGQNLNFSVSCNCINASVWLRRIQFEDVTTSNFDLFLPVQALVTKPNFYIIPNVVPIVNLPRGEYKLFWTGLFAERDIDASGITTTERMFVQKFKIKQFTSGPFYAKPNIRPYVLGTILLVIIILFCCGWIFWTAVPSFFLAMFIYINYEMWLWTILPALYGLYILLLEVK